MTASALFDLQRVKAKNYKVSKHKPNSLLRKPFFRFFWLLGSACAFTGRKSKI
jgi:hypothetical protein